LNKYSVGGVVLALIALIVSWPNSSYPIINKDSINKNIIAFGDSWTQGVGATNENDYPAILSSKINREIINAGVSGNTTTQALARLEEDVLEQEPGIVILLLGGNDIRRKIKFDKSISNVRLMVSKIQSEGAMVVLVGFKLPLFSKYNAAYYDLAREMGCVFVDNIMSGIFSESSLMSDRVHPNDQGYELFAEKISIALKEYLK